MFRRTITVATREVRTYAEAGSVRTDRVVSAEKPDAYSAYLAGKFGAAVVARQWQDNVAEYRAAQRREQAKSARAAFREALKDAKRNPSDTFRLSIYIAPIPFTGKRADELEKRRTFAAKEAIQLGILDEVAA